MRQGIRLPHQAPPGRLHQPPRYLHVNDVTDLCPGGAGGHRGDLHGKDGNHRRGLGLRPQTIKTKTGSLPFLLALLLLALLALALLALALLALLLLALALLALLLCRGGTVLPGGIDGNPSKSGVGGRM